MRLRALAKINLGLDVLRKREDGYHEVRMVMQTIRMYDQLDITRNIQPGILKPIFPTFRSMKTIWFSKRRSF